MLRETTAKDRPRFPWWAIPGAILLAAGFWALAGDVEILNALWYVPAWYGYLLLLDAAIFRLQGHSFLSHRRRELGAMMFWSVPFWFLFEAYNLRLENWYYVFVLRPLAAEVPLAALSYATVLPACFFHAEALKALGLGRGLRWRPRRIGRGWRLAWWVLGVASVAAPLVWPRWAFPLVWGATLWLPDLLNYRVGAPSFLGDLETGRGARLVRLAAGGLWAGGVWEFFNNWARCKWIYTVPGFEEWKLFEMPLLGFLGFPVLAVAAFACYTTVCHFLRGGRSWEAAEPSPARPVPRRAWAGAVALAVAFSLAVHLTMFRHGDHPRRPLLADLEGVAPSTADRLRAAGLPTPERFLAAARAEGVEDLARRLGLQAAPLDEARRHAALALHKGMGTEMASLLLRAGVGDVAELAASDSGELFGRLGELAAEHDLPPPRLAMVKVWVRAARFGGTTRR